MLNGERVTAEVSEASVGGIFGNGGAVTSL